MRICSKCKATDEVPGIFTPKGTYCRACVKLYNIALKNSGRWKSPEYKKWRKNKFKSLDYRKKVSQKQMSRAILCKAEYYKWINTMKAELGCKICGDKRPEVLAFHHKDQEQKNIGISQAINRLWKWSRILSEIKKCDILCANCHRMEHAANSRIYKND